MAEAAPITPKNGEYIGASSVTELIVARFVGSLGQLKSIAGVFTGCRSAVARIVERRNDLHVTHVAKLVGHCQIWPTPEYSGAGHVMSDERSTRGDRWPCVESRVAASRFVGDAPPPPISRRDSSPPFDVRTADWSRRRARFRRRERVT